MAQLLSNGFIDFREFNLWLTIAEFKRSQFFEDQNGTIDGTEIPGLISTYAATDIYAWWNGATSAWDAPNRFVVGGENVAFDANENAISGTVTGFLVNQVFEGKAYYVAFAGFSVGAVEFQQAAMTRGISDDIALLKHAMSGADRITGSAYADFAYGWTGNDKLFGLGGNDTLSGDAGSDQVRGGAGNDVLKGGSGADLLVGEGGDDRLDGGFGTDTLTGGAGADRFIFVEGQLARDQVTDFLNDVDTLVLDADGTGFTVAEALSAASNVAGGVRFDLGGGEILTVFGVTKAQLSDDILVI